MKNEKIVRVCAYCKHACIIKENAAEAPTPMILLTEALWEDDAVTLSCRGKKTVAPDGSCRAFRFDPLKYRPKQPPRISLLDEEALLLD